MAWTIQDLPSLKDKRIVITGANSGIGFDAALVCAQKGAEVILACRNLDKANTAVEQISSDKPSGSATAMELDLSKQSSVRSFAESFLALHQSLDILVNNAGIMMPPYQKTEDGFESQLAVNHLGHYALTGLLLPAILSAPAARIVSISSLAHRWGDMDFDNLMFEDGKGYTPGKAYGRSKLANLLFTRHLQHLLEKNKHKAIAVAAHPGLAQTNLSRTLEKRWYVRLVLPVARKVLLQSAEMGALPTLRALGDPEVVGGDYFGPDGFRQQKGHPHKVGSSKLSRDPQCAEKLWAVSQDLTKVQYQWPDPANS